MTEAEFTKELLRVQDHLMAMSMRLVHKTPDAHDLRQDVNEKMWKSRDRFMTDERNTRRNAILAWAAVIMRNHLYSVRRKELNPNFVMLSFGSPDDIAISDQSHLCGPDEYGPTAALKDVKDNLGKLPYDQREAVTLLAAGYTYLEAAAHAGTCQGTIKSRVSRGRKTLAAACL